MANSNIILTVYTHVLVNLVYKSTSIHTNPYIRWGEKGYIISEKNVLLSVYWVIKLLSYPTIPKLYPATFGNDDKSHKNKSRNEITVQLCAKVAWFFSD